MRVSKKIKNDIVLRLQRVADGQPPMPKEKPVRSRSTWKLLSQRSGYPAFTSQCEGCGHHNSFHVRKEKNRYKWKPYRPLPEHFGVVPVLYPATRHISKGVLEQLLDQYTEEK